MLGCIFQLGNRFAELRGLPEHPTEAFRPPSKNADANDIALLSTAEELNAHSFACVLFESIFV